LTEVASVWFDQLRALPRSAWAADVGPAALCFDVGGTRVRYAVLRPGSAAVAVDETETPRGTVDDFEALLDLLADVAERASEQADVAAVGLSLAVAMDHVTGALLGSGPLWGGQHPRQDSLISDLARRTPGLDWVVLNDVTAQAIGTCLLPEASGLSKLSVLNIGTGIALRSIRPDGFKVDVASSGLQGEVGHLASFMSLSGQPLHEVCDCGAQDHLSAFSSGAAMSRIMARLDRTLYPFLDVAAEPLTAFGEAVRLGDPAAKALLGEFTAPVAHQVSQVFAIDPEVERVFLAGGVVDTFGDAYVESVTARAVTGGSPYETAKADPLAVVRVDPKLNIALRGAALCALASESVRRQWRVEFRQSRTVQFMLQSDVVERLDDCLTGELAYDRPVLLIADASPSLDRACSSAHQRLARGGRDVKVHRVACGEPEKSADTVEMLLDLFGSAGVGRRPAQVVCMGGGTLLDTVGFAASQFRRGIPYVRIPTTLVAMTDAALGLKVGVNRRSAKNRIGAFHPPSAVLIDPTLLRTLPVREFQSGLCECLKLALISGDDSFQFLERNLQELVADASAGSTSDLLMRLVNRFAQLTLRELAVDPYESDLQRPLDLGHTFSPSIEENDHGVRHGEAVALDIALSTAIAERRRLLPSPDAHRVFHVLRGLGVTRWPRSVGIDELWEGLEAAVAHRGGTQNLPIVRGIGGPVEFVQDITREELTEAFSSLMDLFSS